MAKKIDVTLTRSRYQQPMVVVRESPLSGADAEQSPEQLRRLAAALMLIADEADAHALEMPDKHSSYPL